MAYTWQKTRRGASLIIAMFLCVLILLYAMPLANLNVAIIKNIERAQNAGALSDARNSAEQIAGDLVSTATNPFAAANAPVNDYSLYVDGHNGKSIRTDVWMSSGCPVPYIPANSNDPILDLGAVADSTETFTSYDEASQYNGFLSTFSSNTFTTTTLQKHCYGPTYESNAKHYYVYPSPVVNHPYRAPTTVASNCEPRKLYNTYKNEPIDPLSHPCYWGDLEPGETVRIPLNKYGWSLSEITNLKLRLRTKCVDGSDWCKDRGRVTYDGINANTPPRIDDTNVIASWVMEIDDGSINYGSSRGIDLVCPNGTRNCRSYNTHSDITQERMKNGNYFINNNGYLDISNLLGRNGMEVVDLSTNKSVKSNSDYDRIQDSNLLNYLTRIFQNLRSPNIIFQLYNETRTDDANTTLEYQIISSRRLPKK